MKYLKISDNKGFFTVDGTNWQPIDKINKEDLLSILDLALQDDFEMDSYDETKLDNQAHQIIYRSLSNKLDELFKNRSRFNDESNSLYRDAIEKYKELLTNE